MTYDAIDAFLDVLL